MQYEEWYFRSDSYVCGVHTNSEWMDADAVEITVFVSWTNAIRGRQTFVFPVVTQHCGSSILPQVLMWNLAAELFPCSFPWGPDNLLWIYGETNVEKEQR